MTTQPCLSRFDTTLPDWVCAANGPATPAQAAWIAAWFAALLALCWFVGHARQRRRAAQRAAGTLPQLHRDRGHGRPLTVRERYEDADG